MVKTNRYERLAAVIALSVGVATGSNLYAADVGAVAQTKPAACTGCGTVQNIRRVDKPPAPAERATRDIASSPGAGGLGNETKTVPLISLSKEGAKRVKPETGRRPAWEIAVRYDDGHVGFVMSDAEPALKVGDRVRLSENTLEPLRP